MEKTSRRHFLTTLGITLAAPSCATIVRTLPDKSRQEISKPEAKFRLGMASYTFRSFSLEETLIFMKRLGLERISFKSVHLPLDGTVEAIQAAMTKVKASGLEPYAGGVIYMKKEQEVQQAFDYAKAAGMQIIVGVPDHELLGFVQKKVQEYDIRMAIHNHGPTDKLYPTPESIVEKIKDLDSRIGLCLDIGHAQRSAVDPAAAAELFFDRLLDVHIKDVTASSAEGGAIEVGRGVIDIPKFLRTLLRLGYDGTVSLEYEKDEKDPLPGAAESIGYIRGALAAIDGAKT
jgi:sugar phosphate isomerase/epimerase